MSNSAILLFGTADIERASKVIANNAGTVTLTIEDFQEYVKRQAILFAEFTGSFEKISLQTNAWMVGEHNNGRSHYIYNSKDMYQLYECIKERVEITNSR